jgi:hypothetical protein
VMCCDRPPDWPTLHAGVPPPPPRSRYTLNFAVATSGVVVVTADTIYAAMAAMETFSQLFGAGGAGVVSASCAITDFPAYPHRGLLVDAGRRFVPVPLLLNFIDNLAYSKVRGRRGRVCVCACVCECACV